MHDDSRRAGKIRAAIGRAIASPNTVWPSSIQYENSLRKEIRDAIEESNENTYNKIDQAGDAWKDKHHDYEKYQDQMKDQLDKIRRRNPDAADDPRQAVSMLNDAYHKAKDKQNETQ